VIRVSIPVQGGALRAPLAGPFLKLPGQAGMRAGARSRRPAETTASGNHPEDTARTSMALAGQAGLRDGRRPHDGRRMVWVPRVPSRRPPEGLSDRPQGASLATTGQLSSTVAPWCRPDRATPGRRDGTELARMCRVSLALTSEIPWPYPGPPRGMRIGRFSSQ